MAEDSKASGQEGEAQRNVAESLRTAVERTFAATADSAAETRGRAQDLLDEVAKRGQGAREASAEAAQKVVGAAERMRGPSREEVREVDNRLDELGAMVATLSKRVAALEALSERVAKLESPAVQAESEPQVEG